MKHSLPWESVPPPIYPAQASLKPRKKWVQVGGWILVVVLLLFGISTRSRNPLLAFVSLAFSVLYLLTLMTKKSAALTNRGLEIFYDMQFTTNYEFYPWEDINAIVCEDRGHADMVRLHIGHGNTEKAPSQREPSAAALVLLPVCSMSLVTSGYGIPRFRRVPLLAPLSAPPPPVCAPLPS